MALPNPGMNFTPFDVLPAADLNDIVENIEALSAGTGQADSSIGGSKIATYRVLRQNDTTNTTETSARILTGWGVMAYNTGSAAVTEAVTFVSSFTNIPIIMVSLASDNTTNTGYGTGGNTVEGRLNIKSSSQSTSGFSVWVHQGGGSNFSAGFVYYTWIAIGT